YPQRELLRWLPYTRSGTPLVDDGAVNLLHAGELEFAGSVAAHEMTGRHLLPGGRARLADLDGVGAARVEVAARGGGGRVGHLPLQHDAPRAQARVGLRDG